MHLVSNKNEDVFGLIGSMHFQVIGDHFQVIGDHFQVIGDHFKVIGDHLMPAI